MINFLRIRILSLSLSSYSIYHTGRRKERRDSRRNIGVNFNYPATVDFLKKIQGKILPREFSRITISTSGRCFEEGAIKKEEKKYNRGRGVYD